MGSRVHFAPEVPMINLAASTLQLAASTQGAGALRQANQ